MVSPKKIMLTMIESMGIPANMKGKSLKPTYLLYVESFNFKLINNKLQYP